MKNWNQSLLRIAVCILLAIPFYSVGIEGFFFEAILGYSIAMTCYWGIQAIVGFRRPTDGLLVIGLFALLYLLLPAMAKVQ